MLANFSKIIHHNHKIFKARFLGNYLAVDFKNTFSPLLQIFFSAPWNTCVCAWSARVCVWQRAVRQEQVTANLSKAAQVAEQKSIQDSWWSLCPDSDGADRMCWCCVPLTCEFTCNDNSIPRRGDGECSGHRLPHSPSCPLHPTASCLHAGWQTSTPCGWVFAVLPEFL